MSKFDKIAKDWDTKPRRVILAENVYKGIKAKVNLDNKMNVLDIGTGTGLLLMHIQPYVNKITGMDNSAGMLDMLKVKAEKFNLTNLEYLLLDADKETLPKEKYDLAVSSMAFHHLNNPKEFLNKVYGTLKEGGKVFIGDLDKEDGSFHSDNDAANVKHFGFNLNNFNDWLIEAGFKNTTVENIFEIDKNEMKYPVFIAYGEK